MKGFEGNLDTINPSNLQVTFSVQVAALHTINNNSWCWEFSRYPRMSLLGQTGHFPGNHCFHLLRSQYQVDSHPCCAFLQRNGALWKIWDLRDQCEQRPREDPPGVLRVTARAGQRWLRQGQEPSTALNPSHPQCSLALLWSPLLQKVHSARGRMG